MPASKLSHRIHRAGPVLQNPLFFFCSARSLSRWRSRVMQNGHSETGARPCPHAAALSSKEQRPSRPLFSFPSALPISPGHAGRTCACPWYAHKARRCADLSRGKGAPHACPTTRRSLAASGSDVSTLCSSPTREKKVWRSQGVFEACGRASQLCLRTKCLNWFFSSVLR